MDTTYLHFSGLPTTCEPLGTRTLAATFGVAPAMLPRIVEPHEIVGRLSAKMSATLRVEGRHARDRGLR